ncbi:MAG: DapH/DapD/GlmU-related protein [Nitrospira sp.]
MYEIIRALFYKYMRPDPLVVLIRNGLNVGENFRMLGGVTIDPSHCWHIAIGDDVTLAPNVHILAHDASTKRCLDFTRIGKVKIGNRVFIGASSIILPGVIIGDDVVVGAGSIVTKSVPDGFVVAGNPARPIGSSRDLIHKRRREMAFSPCFGREYTIDNGITEGMKSEMNQKMVSRFGYVK